MMQRLLAGLIGLPRLMLVGLLILLAGGVLDVLYHSVPVLAPLLGRSLGRDGELAHLVTFIGMLVTLLGVFVGRPRQAQRRPCLRHTRPHSQARLTPTAPRRRSRQHGPHYR